MIFNEQKLAGVFLIEPEPFSDDRGIFRRHFCEKEFSENGIITDVSQCNISLNNYAFTLRGFHYQMSPHEEGKTLSCLKGSIYDIVVDLRIDSETYMQWVSFELNEKNNHSIHIAPGCANAFLTLEDECLIHYYCSQSYAPSFESGIRYDDPSFDFKWPAKPVIISERDTNHPNYKK